MVEQTEQVARGVRFGRVVPTDRLRRTAVLAVVVMIAAAGGAAYGGPVTVPLLRRALLVPGVELPRRTRITCLSNDLAVARGEAVTLSARAAGEVPAAGVVRVAYTAGGVAEFSLVADEKQRDTFAVKIDNVQDGFAYTIVLGDDQSGPHKVKVAVRPAVVSVACSTTFRPIRGCRRSIDRRTICMCWRAAAGGESEGEQVAAGVAGRGREPRSPRR